ncbi:MAG: hypothetical protein QME66_08310 [Candidatus Eisenbacteria bacterium]|nr:hypothetical protein [Candidatus Eisenbacteria bacterium]
MMRERALENGVPVLEGNLHQLPSFDAMMGKVSDVLDPGAIQRD